MWPQFLLRKVTLHLSKRVTRLGLGLAIVGAGTQAQATRIVCKGATGNYITVVGSCPPGYTFVSIAKD